MNRFGVVRATALADLGGLVDAGLFVQARQGRAFVFLPSRDLHSRLGPRGGAS